jgi:hypothetical protein
VLEVSAFGDLPSGVLQDRRDTYTAEILTAARRSWEDEDYE